MKMDFVVLIKCFGLAIFASKMGSEESFTNNFHNGTCVGICFPCGAGAGFR